jgi:hypothetical protein
VKLLIKGSHSENLMVLPVSGWDLAGDGVEKAQGNDRGCERSGAVELPVPCMNLFDASRIQLTSAIEFVCSYFDPI